MKSLTDLRGLTMKVPLSVSVPVGNGFQNLFLHPIVPPRLKHISKLGSPRLHHSPVEEYVHIVRFDVPEDPLIMSDYHDAHLWADQLVDPLSDDFDGVYVEPRVCLVQDRYLWLDNREL